MASVDQTLLYGLLFANAALYALLILGIFKKRGSGLEASSVAEAFLLLEAALKKKFPDMPAGFTWREAMGRIRDMNPRLDWKSLEGVLKGYEAYRYGGFELSYTDPGEVLRLASVLGKGARFVRGP
ncbi:MAG: hypothetical protein HYU03_00760 [Thaumarchaeota archaeon]|nr:hypothetical protein [Nitrososphaerota archaeon]MBI3022679.1 hypothetical protein [Nitrososphaerota archaeon]MBI3116260.1 hypothetical protein [Nitrososphaerota archaeon]MCS4539211.1 hypothetical protein [Nitrososphaerota archaeon]